MGGEPDPFETFIKCGDIESCDIRFFTIFLFYFIIVKITCDNWYIIKTILAMRSRKVTFNTYKLRNM